MGDCRLLARDTFGVSFKSAETDAKDLARVRRNAYAAPMTHPAANKGLHIALWVVQILLAGSFLVGGSFRGFAPMEVLAAQIPWVPAVPAWVTRLSGISEVFGALGLILPTATRIKPILTPISACCLIVVMVLAAGLHASRGEYPFIAVNVMFIALLAFVAWGRLKKVPVVPR